MKFIRHLYRAIYQARMKVYFYLAVPIFFMSFSAQAQDDVEKTQMEIGAHYKSSTRLSNQGSTIIAEDVVALSTGISKDKELARDGGLSLSVQGEASALYGQANNVVIDGIDINQSANYRAAEVFGNLKVEQELGDDWTAFGKAGIGVIYEDLETKGAFREQQKFQDLSPAGKFKAGVEKKVNDRLSIGVAAGKTEKLD